jgi:hypothetical protein
MYRLAAASFMSLILAVSWPVWAADETKSDGKAAQGEKQPAKGASTKQAKSGGDAKNRIVLKDIVIEGKIHKPQAYYVLQRSNLNLEGLELNESFIPKIEKSAGQEPF